MFGEQPDVPEGPEGQGASPPSAGGSGMDDAFGEAGAGGNEDYLDVRAREPPPSDLRILLTSPLLYHLFLQGVSFHDMVMSARVAFHSSSLSLSQLSGGLRRKLVAIMDTPAWVVVMVAPHREARMPCCALVDVDHLTNPAPLLLPLFFLCGRTVSSTGSSAPKSSRRTTRSAKLAAADEPRPVRI